MSSLAAPAVDSGHVAGWVGVGGLGQGPGGSNEWIQVGLNSLPGTSNKLYYEVMRPGTGQDYAEIATDVPNGRTMRIAVLEIASAPGSWRIWVNGRAVTPPISLPGSHGALSPMAMGESWDGGRPACNRYRYRFANVRLAAAPGGSWQPVTNAAVLQDPGYQVVKRAAASFDAGATAPLPAASPAPAPETTARPAAGGGGTPKAVKPATQEVTIAAKPKQKAAGAAAQPAVLPVRRLAARAISASAPLRKGEVPAPTLAAVVALLDDSAVTAQAPEPAASGDPVSETEIAPTPSPDESQAQGDPPAAVEAAAATDAATVVVLDPVAFREPGSEAVPAGLGAGVSLVVG